MPQTRTADFIATSIKKADLAVYYLLAGCIAQVSILFPDRDKND